MTKRADMITKQFYLCDPEKNISCKKTECQKNCFATSKIEFAKHMTPLTKQQILYSDVLFGDPKKE